MRIKNLVKSILSKLHTHKKTKPDIYIFTLPRAGSTLLAEILNTDRTCKLASESLALNNDNKEILKNYFQKDFLAERYTDLSILESEKMFNYYSDLSEGKTWNSYYWSDLFNPTHKFKTSRTIFKTHKITYHYDFFMNHFKDEFGIYLLRNPISHSLSRINLNWDSYIDLYATSNRISNLLTNKAKKKIEQVVENSSILEKFVTSWCLENYIFLHQYKNNNLPTNVTLLRYEELLINSELTIKNLCSKISLDYHPNMLKCIDLPSSGIVHSTSETKTQIESGNKNYLINRWKDKVDPEMREKIKDILKSFDISLYLEEI